MSLDTDSSELSPRRYRENRELNRQYEDRYVPSNKGNINGQDTFTRTMLVVIAMLLAGAISGQVWFNNTITEKVAAVSTTVALIIEGKIRVSRE